MNLAVTSADIHTLSSKSELASAEKNTIFNTRHLHRLDACFLNLLTEGKQIYFLSCVQTRMNQSRGKRASGRGKGKGNTKQDSVGPELNVEVPAAGPFARPPEPGKGDLQVIVLVSPAYNTRITIPIPSITSLSRFA